MNKQIEQLKQAYWNAKTQAKFAQVFPRTAKECQEDTDCMFEHLVQLCADNVDEYTTLEDSVCGFLCE